MKYLYIAALLLASSLNAQAADKPVNVLFILVDDQRNDTLGCAGHPVIKTPNIDQLAKQGVRFENAFVNTAICMASRATIFTGLSETSHGYTGGGPPAVPVQKMDVDSSFPVLLRAASYRTGFYGKQHVKFAEKNEPALKRMFHDHKVYNGGPHHVKLPDGTMRHTAELIGDRSVEFIESQPADQPFCLYMSFNIAHARDGDHRPGIGHFPWPKAVDGLYEDIEPAAPRLGDPKYFEMQPEFLQNSMNRDRWFWRWDTPAKYRLNMQAYYRMLTGMDAVIGRVQQAIKKQGFTDNTVVIYTADNGYYMGDRGFAGKWSHYEQSLRVPMIIHDPRLAKKHHNRVLSQMVMNLDLPATILDLAGVAVPKKYQGKSLVPFTVGKTPASWRTDLFNEHHFNHARIPKWQGVRSERYTYARYYGQEPVYEFLHDLENDPDQIKNLADSPEHANILKKMRDRTNEYKEMYTRPEIEALRGK
ncbi:MAG: mucin-desulfating sulfatase [Blastopirellula sp.]|nr:MAG: mucin-desulfating sulfatase [Blastopirellula sp.]